MRFRIWGFEWLGWNTQTLLIIAIGLMHHMSRRFSLPSNWLERLERVSLGAGLESGTSVLGCC